MKYISFSFTVATQPDDDAEITNFPSVQESE